MASSLNAAEALDNGEFFLPSHFLTDDDILMDKENISMASSEANLSFPSEFPFCFGSYGSSSSSALNSPVESVNGSTETESDEDDFLAGLTRKFVESTRIQPKKSTSPTGRVVAGSPQSTLSAFGSPNSQPMLSSRHTAPFNGTNEEEWRLIFEAAGQIARLKMSNEAQKYHQQGRGILVTPGNSNITAAPPPVKKPTTGFQNFDLCRTLPQTNSQCSSPWGGQMQNRARCFEGSRCTRPTHCLPQSTWPPLQASQQQQQKTGSDMRAVFLNGSGVRRESTGTGVFLPRRFGTPTEARKKTGCSTVLLPARVVQALNLDLDMDTRAQAQGRVNGGFAPINNDVLLNQRSSFMAQQRRVLTPEVAPSHEIRLPQEWTY